MKILFDLFPIFLFFAAYQVGEKNPVDTTAWLAALGILLGGAKPGVFLATLVAMVATFGQIAWVWLRHRKVDTMLWVSLVLIVVFGGATLLLHDETFIKWKPTVLYWLFGCVLLVSQFFLKRNLLRKLLGEKIAMADRAWARLSVSWSVFFLAAGGLNLFVAFSGMFTEAQWVNFKVFGLMGLLIVFVIVQSVWLGRHIEHTNEAQDTEKGKA